ncbi:MFS transporter [Nonomuraea sp. NPDC003560]|uniref:MFS transporter n=1 Tax=Nonomuraea sp. NPDC003560 TaxID=3364341 RepID=UPI0036B67029
MLAIVLICQTMFILDTNVVNIALPDIQHDLGFSAAGLSWVLNAYMLAFGGLLLLGGRVGDIVGQRRALVGGVAVFTLASLAGGLATSAGMLLAARAGQGRRRRPRPTRPCGPRCQLPVTSPSTRGPGWSGRPNHATRRPASGARG